MTRETNLELLKLFRTETAKEYFAQDASISSQARILMNKLTSKFTELFNYKSSSLAKTMVEQSQRYSTTTLNRSLDQLTGGLSLNTGLITPGLEDVSKSIIAENVSLIKSIPQKYFTDVTGAVMRSISAGGLFDLQPQIAKYDGMTQRRAQLIALDQTRKAYTLINVEKMKSLGLNKFQWMHTGGSQSPRHSHVKIDGMIFSYANIIAEQRAAGVPERDLGLPSIPVNCFLGNTEVSLANGCRNLWRYLHEGDIVNIVMHGGSAISCTLNHPILTLRGWLPANEIQEGDYLIGSQVNDALTVDVEIARNKITFDDFFASQREVAGGVKTFLGSKFNFHGDIPKNDVDAISINNILPDWTESLNDEQIEQLILAFSDIVTNTFIPSAFSKIDNMGGSGGFRKFFTFINGKFRHSDQVCFASVAQQNSVICQDSSDGLPTDIVFHGKIQNGLTVCISCDDIGCITISEVFTSNGRDNIIESFFQSSGQVATADFFINAKLFHSNFGVKILHRVDKKFISVFRGHVYTIESYNGWYNVASTDIISKNCRCRALPIIELSD